MTVTIIVTIATASVVSHHHGESASGGSQSCTISSQISPVGTLVALSPHFADGNMGPEKVSSSLSAPPHRRSPHPPNPGPGVCPELPFALCPPSVSPFWEGGGPRDKVPLPAWSPQRSSQASLLLHHCLSPPSKAPLTFSTADKPWGVGLTAGCHQASTGIFLPRFFKIKARGASGPAACNR